MIGPCPRFDWIDARVNIVPRWRAHRSGLKTARKLHSFRSESIQMRRRGLPAVDFHVEISAVVGDHKYQIRSLRSAGRR